MTSEEYYKAKITIEKKGLAIARRDMELGYKKVRSHQYRYESFMHFISKSAISKIIGTRARQAFFTEFELPNGRTIDVLQVISPNEIVGYEIETSKDNKKNDIKEVPIITVDLRKAPKDVLEAFDILENYFKKFVV